MSWIDQARMLGELLGAMLLGGLVGLEREAAEKSAGIRTHMLVAGASCLLVGLGIGVALRFAEAVGTGFLVRADPTRLVVASITGLSFLGAGTIFRSDSRNRVQGLTTAASILCCGAIGIAVAARLYLLAVGATLLTLMVLHPLQRFGTKVVHRTGHPDDEKHPHDPAG